MKSTNICLFAFLLFISIFSCQRKQYSFDALPDQYVVFGNGGGFAAAAQEYYLFPDGQVIELVGLQQDTILHPSIKKKIARNIIDSCLALPLKELNINEPGNTYFFLQQVSTTGDNKATWGNHQYAPPADLLDMYNRLTQILVKEDVD